jgi:hypothetical protein
LTVEISIFTQSITFIKLEADMSTTTTTFRAPTFSGGAWLRSRNWDLIWISLSVLLVTTPYLAYLGLQRLPALMGPLAETFGTNADDLARNLVNATVALLIGGPHMYATFTRTALDRGFAGKHSKLLWSSLLIPVVVTALALFNLTLLLTIFFFWASVHVLHQIIYIVELYNRRQRSSLSIFSRFADYGVVLTALYPLAAWKIANGTFAIGNNNLSLEISKFLPLGPWMYYLAGSAFTLALAAWIFKSVREYQQGKLHWPKTIFIALTVTASFFVPALGNLDTAFQGMNVWHSLQYLALTWMLNRLRQQRGELQASPFVERLSNEGSARRYYLFNIGLTVADALLAVVILAILLYIFNRSFDYAFDRAYYIAVLSILWIHYYHDHFLFSAPGVIET